MVSAFDKMDANFDGVVADGSDAQLYISHVFHDTYVAVDETGPRQRPRLAASVS